MDLDARIESIKPYQLNCNIFTVYDTCGVSVQELLSQFFEKVNSCIDISNQTVELAKWLVNEGLEIEVAKKLELWLVDGTLGKIINEILLKELEEKIELNADNIDKLILYDKKQDDSISSIRDKSNDNASDINWLKGENRTQNDRLQALEDNTGGSGELPVRYVTTEGKSTMDMVDDLNNTSIQNNSKNILRVGSFNVNSFRDRDTRKATQVGYEVLKARLDICCIQEFIQFFKFHSSWWIKIPKALEYTTNNQLWKFDGGWAGQGILSHHPLNNNINGKYSDVVGKEPRGYIRTTINIGNKQVNVYNTHLTHDDMTMLRNEMSELANAIRGDNATYKIVCGDFNTRTESDYQPLLNLGFKFALSLTSGTIDNVLVQNNVNVKDAYKVMIDDYISDHDLVVTELELI